jgi:polysaccharide export outer membrane protein
VVATLDGQVRPEAASPTAAEQQAAAGIATPADYVIGVGDVLIITYWKEPEMTGEQQVRPDGMITLPLLNDVPALGLKPEQLRDHLLKLSVGIKDPRITVGVKTINSRKVYISGAVGKAGEYDLLVPMRVNQLIALAGGVTEFADEKNISIIRVEGAKQQRFKFNYKEVKEGKKLEQNILLKPGDTVAVSE